MLHKQKSHTKYDIKQKGKAEKLGFPVYTQTAERNFRKKIFTPCGVFQKHRFYWPKNLFASEWKAEKEEKKVHLEKKETQSMCGLKRHKGLIWSGQKASLRLNILEIFIQHDASRVAHIQLERE